MPKINRVYKQLYNVDKLRTDVRYFEIYGGRRSGKSYDVTQIIAIEALRHKHFVVSIRKVAATLKDSVYSEFVDFFARNNIQVSCNKTDKEITLPNGSRIRCFGLDDPEKLKSLKGPTIVWFEEATEISEGDFDSIDAGLSPTTVPARVFLTHNPLPQIPGSQHWIQKRFLGVEHKLSQATVNDEANAIILRTWYKDNAFCPPETVKLLEGYKRTNPQKYKLWTLGEFTKMEGLVFENWDIVKSIPEGILHDSIGVGLDFGYSVDPAAAVRLWIHGDDLYIKTLVYKTGLTNDMLYRELQHAGVTTNERITADSAEPKSIEDLYKAGLRGIKGVKKRANYKLDMVNRVRGYRIHLIEGDTDLIREFSTYAWCRDKNGKQLAALPDGDDHGIDAMIMRLHENMGSQTVSAYFK